MKDRDEQQFHSELVIFLGQKYYNWICWNSKVLGFPYVQNVMCPCLFWENGLAADISGTYQYLSIFS